MSQRDMNNVNKTLYIPLYGKAYVSRRSLFLSDKRAEEIWEAEGFSLKGRSKSKWLAYYMGIRSAVFDDWLREQLKSGEETAVVHIGCGMDARVLRVDAPRVAWYDVDFPEVIGERRRYYGESECYRMLEGDARDPVWLSQIPCRKRAVVVMEGIGMYLSTEELQALLVALGAYFDEVSLLLDCYTQLAAKMSKIKNPVKDVGVTSVWGIDDPRVLQVGGLSLVGEHEMTPSRYVEQLRGMEQRIFRRLYAGKLSRRLYRLFEYEKRCRTVDEVKEKS